MNGHLRHGFSWVRESPEYGGKTKKSSIDILHMFSIVSSDFSEFSKWYVSITHRQVFCKSTVKVKHAFCSSESFPCKMSLSAARLLRREILYSTCCGHILETSHMAYGVWQDEFLSHPSDLSLEYDHVEGWMFQRRRINKKNIPLYNCLKLCQDEFLTECFHQGQWTHALKKVPPVIFVG